MDHRGDGNRNNGERKPFRSGERTGGAWKNERGEKKDFAKKDFVKKDFAKKDFAKKDKPANGQTSRGSYNKKRSVNSSARFNRGAGMQKKPAAPWTPGARDVALKALKSVARDNAYAAQALDRELKTASLSADDRRLAASLFYYSLENRLRIEHCLAAKLEHRPDPEVMDILCLACAQLLFMDKIPDHAAVDEAVEQARRAKREGSTALVNAVLRAIIRDRDAGALALPDKESEPEKYLSEMYSVALPLIARLVKDYGVGGAEQIVSWSPDRRVDSIRPNRMRMNDAQFEEYLTREGFSWERGIVNGAYRVRDAGRLAAHEGYRTGNFSIQGESSMLAAYAVAPKPGTRVLDACAAPGGKSCLIAEMMRGSGRVYAWDLHEHRVELIRAAARRLELDNIQPRQYNAAEHNEHLDGEMDAVLIDAPCSGLGVMGDKPDIKYRLTDETINALIPIQRAILENCASYVCPGGLLVYSTCTILPEENEMQVQGFLEAHPEFEADTDDRWLPEAFKPLYQNGMLQLLPGRDGVDGFFIARLRRRVVQHG